MVWNTIRSAGCSGRSAGGRTDDEDNARFLRETVEQFATLSAKYCDTVGEMPFVYHERQVHSALLPAIARASDAVLAEHPIRRVLSRDDCRTSGHGWLDYWVLCGTTVFLVELKHVFRGATAREATFRLSRPWETANQQISSIADEEALALATAARRVVKLALLVMPAYRNSASIDRLDPIGRDMAREAHLATCSSLEPSPQWCCMVSHQRCRVRIKWRTSHGRPIPG